MKSLVTFYVPGNRNTSYYCHSHRFRKYCVYIPQQVSQNFDLLLSLFLSLFCFLLKFCIFRGVLKPINEYFVNCSLELGIQISIEILLPPVRSLRSHLSFLNLIFHLQKGGLEKIISKAIC